MSTQGTKLNLPKLCFHFEPTMSFEFELNRPQLKQIPLWFLVSETNLCKFIYFFKQSVFVSVTLHFEKKSLLIDNGAQLAMYE